MIETLLQPPLGIYIYAVIGSIGIELASLLRNLSDNDGRLPPKYRTWSYPVVRILFTVVGAGPLALMMDAKTSMIAFYIGVSAPLIYDRAAAGIKPDKPDKPDAPEDSPSS